jgi:release factor glutamine methyltransferase
VTLRELLNEGCAVIGAGKDSSTAWLDATVLWAFAADTSRDRVLAALRDPADGPVGRFLELCARRATGCPVAYLTGAKEFFGRDFRVDESVLIPRPETELLVEWVLETLGADDAGPRASAVAEPLAILDCCTGSGCIPVTLGLELAGRGIPARIDACDLSTAAIDTARRNTARLFPGNAIAWHLGDLLAAVPVERGRFDIITANPPYVPRDEALRTETLGWREPLMALDGGEDGLNLIRRFVPQAAGRLNPGGWLFMEFGDGQQQDIVAILHKYDYRSTEIRCDLAGLPRMVRARSGERNGQGS